MELGVKWVEIEKIPTTKAPWWVDTNTEKQKLEERIGDYLDTPVVKAVNEGF